MRAPYLAACAPAALLLVFSQASPPVQEAAKGPGGETVALRLNLRKGDRFAYRFVSDIDQSTKMGGLDMGTKVRSEKEVTYAVESVAEDGSAWLEVKVGPIKGKMTAPMMGEIEFDSSKEEDDADPRLAGATKHLTALGGKTFRMRVTTSGRVAEVRGMAEAMKGVFDEGPSGNPMMAKAMNEAFSDEGMRKMAETYFAKLPEAPVAPGGAWDAEYDVPSPGPGLDMVLKGKSTLEKVDGEEASIATTGTLSTRERPAGEKGAAEEGGMDAQTMAALRGMKVEKGEVQSTTRVSRKDGLPLHTTSLSAIEITMPMGGGSLRTSTRTTTTIERTSLPAESPASRPG